MEEAPEEAPAPKGKKEKKAKPVEKVEEEEKDEDDEEEAPAKKDSGDAAEGEQLTIFVGGIPWSTSEDTVRKDFAECGEIEKLHMPMNEEGKPKGIAFITYKNKKGVEAALKFD